MGDGAVSLPLFDLQELFHTNPDLHHPSSLALPHSPASPWPSAPASNAPSCWLGLNQPQHHPDLRARARGGVTLHDKIAAPARPRDDQVRQMASIFDLHIADAFAFTSTRAREEQHRQAEAVDGSSQAPCTCSRDRPGRDETRRCARTAHVERFFRTRNSELDARPICHRLADRVRGTRLCMLSYYISWHMKHALAPILFQDNDKPAAAAKRADPVAPAQRSDQALTKVAQTHRRCLPGAQLHQPAHRPSHHLRQLHPTHPRPASIHQDHHPHPCYNGAPSTY